MLVMCTCGSIFFYTAESDIEDREARPLLGIVAQCKCTYYVICWPTM